MQRVSNHDIAQRLFIRTALGYASIYDRERPIFQEKKIQIKSKAGFILRIYPLGELEPFKILLIHKCSSITSHTLHFASLNGARSDIQAFISQMKVWKLESHAP